MRSPNCPTRCSKSLRTGTAISAAAVGVGARKSAAKSHRVVSVSCPTAEIIGIVQSATARTTASSLKAQRSSIEPPPRATITRSGRVAGPSCGIAENPLTARAIWAADPSPCTNTGQTITWVGKRSANLCKMSRMTAPVGDVTTPMVRGKDGSFFLRSGANSPSAARRAFSFSNKSIIAPSPATSRLSTTI